MKYPTLTELGTSRQMIDVFGGYNHNLRIGEGEFYDMENLTSADYPVLSPRPKRGVYKSPTNPLGMISKDNLCYLDGDDFYIQGNKVEGLTLNAEESRDGGKALISMGAYVIILPDKVWVNTQPNEDAKFDHGLIEVSKTISEGTATFSLCAIDGEEYKVDEGNIGTTAPSEPKNMELWLDTSNTPHVLRRYSEIQEQWVAIPTTYIRISFSTLATDLTKLFAEGDGVTISGTENITELSDFSNTMVLWKVEPNAIIVTGILDKVEEVDCKEHKISFTRSMPDMDYVIESGNRLWGCKYGVSDSANGQVVNEIYASKLGDFKNWHCFAGISTDSYVASVGTDGEFTGAITHLGYPLFFKENCIHKVYGNYPANYQIQTTVCRGVQRGCPKSLAIVNEKLYYKSRSAVCSYDGSLPMEISSALGDMTFDLAVAGVLGNKYYISMREVNGDTNPRHLFVYDTAKGMWHREDNTQATDFCNSRGELYYIDYADKQIKMIRGTGDYVITSPVKWKAETGIIGTDSPDKKYISRLVVRLSLEVGTRVTFFVQYDSISAWEHLFTMTGTSLRSFSVPIRPKRCDHLRLRIEGEGEAKIYSICKTIEQGSDV